MTEFSISDNKFDDIEMLDIPDDDTSSETNTMSESEATPESISSSRLNFSKQVQNVELQEWLDSKKTLDFEFDENEYKKSLLQNDDFSKSYTKYVNSLYKIVENLTNNDVTRIGLEKEDEFIGLISNSSDIGPNAGKRQKFCKVDEAFNKILENLDQFMKEISEENNEEFEQFFHLSNILECLKANSFCENIKLKPELLANWINKYDPKPDNDLVETVMINNPKPYLHPQFWNTYLAQLISRGLLTQASTAIAHSKFQELVNISPDLYAVISDLKVLLENYSSMALSNKFAQWKLSCCEFRDTFSNFKSSITEPGHIITINQIYDLMCILTGLPKTISSHCDNWYEILVGVSLFQVRDDADVYKEYYDLSVNEKPPAIFDDQEEDLFKITEQCFINIFEGNYLKVLKTVFQFDPVTAAYLSKLLELKGFLSNYYSNFSNSKTLQDLINKKTISEYFLIAHAYSCLNVHNLVPVGIGLLLNSDISTSYQHSAENRKTIADFLPKFTCKTNDDLEWALTICAELNLVSTARELYYIYGIKSLKKGFLFESLNMFVNCYDPNSLSESNNKGMKQVHYILWDLIFYDSLVNNRLIKDELINNIVSKNVETTVEVHPVIRQCLSPYAVLAEFYQSLSYRESEPIRAMEKLSKLIHLIRFNHLPKKFYPLLLSQCIPFLKNDQYTFTLPDLIIIVELIDTYESNVTAEEYKNGESLYQYSVTNFSLETESYDWRAVLKQSNTEVPKDVKHLIKFLRNEIVAKIGQVYIKNI